LTRFPDGPYDTAVDHRALPISGRLIGFVIGRVAARVEPTASVEPRTLKAAPNYPDIMPRQHIIETGTTMIKDREALQVVKTYTPGYVIVEIGVAIDDLLTDPLFDLHNDLLEAGRRVLDRYDGDAQFQEEYRVYCISNYRGDPEVFLTLHGERIVGLLKDERIPLDEEEVWATLQSNIKYSKDDLTIVDWDGAVLFDPHADFSANIELLQIANFQLLRLRTLDRALDVRLGHVSQLIQTTPKRSFFRAGEIRAILREIIQIRADTIFESQAAEHRIKLIGDWYAARVYALVAKKFHLDAWQASIQQKLDTLEDVSTMAAENFSVSFHTKLDFILIGGWFLLLAGWFGYLFFDLYLLSLR